MSTSHTLEFSESDLEVEYRRCTRCIMDTTDPDIQFDEIGECNHCREYDEYISEHVLTGEEEGEKSNSLSKR